MITRLVYLCKPLSVAPFSNTIWGKSTLPSTFKRYEDSSLEYTGINTYAGTRIGGWDTVIEVEKASASSTSSAGTELSAAAETPPDTLPEQAENVNAVEEPEARPWAAVKVGEAVIHKSFGKGFVRSVDDKYIIVNFGSGDKKFLYPDIFEREYMFMANPGV